MAQRRSKIRGDIPSEQGCRRVWRGVWNLQPTPLGGVLIGRCEPRACRENRERDAGQSAAPRSCCTSGAICMAWSPRCTRVERRAVTPVSGSGQWGAVYWVQTIPTSEFLYLRRAGLRLSSAPAGEDAKTRLGRSGTARTPKRRFADVAEVGFVARLALSGLHDGEANTTLSTPAAWHTEWAA
jgi:hypothetical protein